MEYAFTQNQSEAQSAYQQRCEELALDPKYASFNYADPKIKPLLDRFLENEHQIQELRRQIHELSQQIQDLNLK
jgi:hypothetical protein